VVGVLDRLFAAVEVEDGPAKQRVQAREEELGERLTQAERYELYGDAPLAIKREVGELLYMLVLSRRAQRIVEFGASLGVSTIYLAAALADCGGGSLITTELRPSKAEIARRNLTDAGLADLVELRLGDARRTLTDLRGRPVDLLFLDGRNDLYLPVLRLLEPHLAPNGLVAADLNADDPDLDSYLEYVRDPDRGYYSICVALDAGLELSVRAETATSSHPSSPSRRSNKHRSASSCTSANARP
jgi:predicted O-methyltransferase YrrM